MRDTIRGPSGAQSGAGVYANPHGGNQPDTGARRRGGACADRHLGGPDMPGWLGSTASPARRHTAHH